MSSMVPRRQMRDDEFDDDFDIDLAQRRRGQTNPTSAGMIGFIFAMVAAGLVAIIIVLWVLLKQDEQQNQVPEGRKVMLLWFMFLVMLSLVASIFACVMGGIGLKPSNPLYRGWSLAALILGIIEIVGTIIFSFVLTCGMLCF